MIIPNSKRSNKNSRRPLTNYYVKTNGLNTEFNLICELIL